MACIGRQLGRYLGVDTFMGGMPVSPKIPASQPAITSLTPTWGRYTTPCSGSRCCHECSHACNMAGAYTLKVRGLPRS